MRPFKKWLNKYCETMDTPSLTSLAEDAWNACKQECLKILKEPLHNCDLSVDYTDSRTIERIEKEL